MGTKPIFARANYTRKHRVHTWFNADTQKPQYGIEAHIEYGKWAHVVDDDGKLMLFDDKNAAKAVILGWAIP